MLDAKRINWLQENKFIMNFAGNIIESFVTNVSEFL